MMPGIIDSLLGTPQPSRTGTLSSLASMPFNMPSIIPTMPWSTPGYGSGMGADNLTGALADGSPPNNASGFSRIPPIRIGSPTVGLAPGNSWGDAPTTASSPVMQMQNDTDGLPPSISVPGGPIAPPAANAQPHHSFFSQGGAGQAIAGILGDALLTATNHAPIYAPIMAQQQQEAMRARLQTTQQNAELLRQKQLDDYKRANDRQVVNMGNGGVAQWGGDGSFTVLREPDAPDPKQTQLEQNVDYLRKLNPTMTDAQAAAIVQRGIQGYQYDPNYMAQRQDNTIAAIGARGNQARVTKATPTGNATRPHGSGGGPAAGMSTRDLLSTLGR